MKTPVDMSAVRLHFKDGAYTYAVRPRGQLGTVGWAPVPWVVQYVKAHTEKEALQKANPLYQPK